MNIFVFVGFVSYLFARPPSRFHLPASDRCAKGNAKNLGLSDLSVQGHNGFLLAQGKNCLARGQGALRNSADMQASCRPCRPVPCVLTTRRSCCGLYNIKS